MGLKRLGEYYLSPLSSTPYTQPPLCDCHGCTLLDMAVGSKPGSFWGVYNCPLGLPLKPNTAYQGISSTFSASPLRFYPYPRREGEKKHWHFISLPPSNYSPCPYPYQALSLPLQWEVYDTVLIWHLSNPVPRSCGKMNAGKQNV